MRWWIIVQMHFIYMDFGWDFHFFLIIMSSRRKSKSDGSESLKSFQRASIFPTFSLDCSNTNFCWIRGLLVIVWKIFILLVCKSLQSRGDSSRKLSPFFVETASHHNGAIVIYFSSHHKGATRQLKSATSHRKVPPSYTLKLPQITRMPPTSKGCQITSQECHPHHKCAR